MFNRSKFVSCYVVFAIYRFIDRGPTCAVLAVSTAIALPLCGKLEECVSWKRSELAARSRASTRLICCRFHDANVGSFAAGEILLDSGNKELGPNGFVD